MGEKNLKEIFGKPISVYTADQAEDDGLLIKVKDSDINYMTRAVYFECIDKFLIKVIMSDRDSIPEKDENILKGHPSASDLIHKLISSAKLAVIKIQLLKGTDWFYAIEARGWKFFVCQNETGKYTLMFPEDY